MDFRGSTGLPVAGEGLLVVADGPSPVAKGLLGCRQSPKGYLVAGGRQGATGGHQTVAGLLAVARGLLAATKRLLGY